MTQISRFIGEVVPIAQRVTGDGDESAATIRGGGFAKYAYVSLHRLRIYLDTSYRMTIDLLKETQLLMTIPDVNYYTTLTIYAELGEIDRFDGDKEVVSYIRLNPARAG